MRQLVGYVRVSTTGQGASGLGLGDQRARVEAFAERTGARIVQTFEEVESGGRADRPALAEALDLCELTGATLCVATLDRLSRDVAFLEEVKRRCEAAGFGFVCCDMPDATALTLGLLAQIAQYERQRIGERTKAALAQARARGTILGNPAGIAAIPPEKRQEGAQRGAAANQERADQWARKRAGIVQRMRHEGASLRTIAAELSDRGIRTPRGGTYWSAGQVGRLLARLDTAA